MKIYFFHADIRILQHHLLKRTSLSHWMTTTPLLKTIALICESVYIDSLFHSINVCPPCAKLSTLSGLKAALFLPCILSCSIIVILHHDFKLMTLHKLCYEVVHTYFQWLDLSDKLFLLSLWNRPLTFANILHIEIDFL